MKEFIDKLIERLEQEHERCINRYGIVGGNALAMEVKQCIDIVTELAKKFGTGINVVSNGWIACSERLPECENKYGWVSCIVSVIRSHYPTSPYDICDSPYDENIVMHANYNVSQKIWHLESDEQLNALIDIEDAPLNGDYVLAWMPLPAPYTEGE